MCITMVTGVHHKEYPGDLEAGEGEHVTSISICGFDYRLKMARNKELSSKTILVLRNDGEKFPRN